MKLKYRILFILSIIGIFIIYKSYNCIILNFSPIPKLITNNSSLKLVIILYGYGICGTCPSGKFINSIKDKQDVLFIIPPELTNYEIENMKNAFNIKGELIKGDKEIAVYLNKISECKKKYNIRENIFIELNDNGEIKLIKKI